MNSEVQDIAIIGAGGLGKEIAVLISQINQVQKKWNLVGFFDDGVPAGSNVLSLPVLGNTDAANQSVQHIIIAIGDPSVKAAIVKKLTNKKLTFPTLVHPSVSLGQEITLGEGTVVCAGSVLTVHVNIGSHVLINLNTTIGHDVVVGDYTSIMPGSHLSGFVKIGALAFIGTGTSILQNVHIDRGAIVGAGAVVNRNVNANTTVVGVPAREIQKQS